MCDEMCRLCLSKQDLSVIFVDLLDIERHSVNLELITGLKIKKNDGLPQKICKNCIESVNYILNFRSQCHDSEVELLKLGFIRKEWNKKINIGKELEENDVILEKNAFKEDVAQDSIDKDGLNVDYTQNNRALMYDFDLIKIKNREISSEVNKESCQLNYFLENTQESSSDKTGLPLLQIEVECNRLNEKQDGVDNLGGQNKRVYNRKKAAKYMDYVYGSIKDSSGPVKCKACKKTLSKWACFRSHVKKLHLGFKCTCEYCGKSFSSSTQLKRHCRSYHGVLRELACSHCDYRALDKQQLMLHERRVHTGERPFVCYECGAAYHSRRCLLQHIEGHRDTANVLCEQCPRKFKSSRHLARHRYKTHVLKRAKNNIVAPSVH